VTSSSIFAVHANSSRETLFLCGKDIEAYLKKFETNEVKVQEIDFAALATAPAAAAQVSKPPVKEREDAKIEGAVQIAIGVKKEVDFPSWYTNVRCSCSLTTVSCLKVICQVLIKADMIDYYSVSGCYILKPWSYSIWEEIQCMSVFYPTCSDYLTWRSLVRLANQGTGCAKLIFPFVCLCLRFGTGEESY